MRSKLAWIISGVLAALGFVLMFMSLPGSLNDELTTAISGVSSQRYVNDQTIKASKQKRDQLQREADKRKSLVRSQAKTVVLNQYSESQLNNLDLKVPNLLGKFSERIDEHLNVNPIGFNKAGQLVENPYVDDRTVPATSGPFEDLNRRRANEWGGGVKDMLTRVALSGIDLSLETLRETAKKERPTTFKVMSFNFSELDTQSVTASAFGEDDPYDRYTFSVLISGNMVFLQKVVDAFANLEHPNLHVQLVGWSYAPPVYPRGRAVDLTWEDYQRMGIYVDDEDKKDTGSYDDWRSDRMNDGFDEEREALMKDVTFNPELPSHLTLKLQLLEAKPGHPVFAEVRNEP